MWMPFQHASAVEVFLAFSVMWMLIHIARAVGAALSIFRFFCHVDATPQRQCSRCSIVTFSVMWMLLHYASAVGAALSISGFFCHVDAIPARQCSRSIFSFSPQRQSSRCSIEYLSLFLSSGCHSTTPVQWVQHCHFFCHVDATPLRQCSRCSSEYLWLFLSCGCHSTAPVQYEYF